MRNSILNDILAYKKREVQTAKERLSLAQLKNRMAALPPTKSFKGALRGETVALIAEIKFKSPSKGEIRGDLSLHDILNAYREAGTEAISILTDHRFFGGSESYLVNARRQTEQALLRKDFIIDPYQIYQSRFLGADAILLIARILSFDTLKSFIQLARQLGLDALVECRTGSEVSAALAAGAEIIGINNRNLDTFETDLRTTLDLAPKSKRSGVVVVSESGIRTREDVVLLRDSGIDAVLVGEALMASPQIKEKALSLRGVPTLRKVVSSCLR